MVFRVLFHVLFQGTKRFARKTCLMPELHGINLHQYLRQKRHLLLFDPAGDLELVIFIGFGGRIREDGHHFTVLHLVMGNGHITAGTHHMVLIPFPPPGFPFVAFGGDVF